MRHKRQLLEKGSGNLRRNEKYFVPGSMAGKFRRLLERRQRAAAAPRAGSAFLMINLRVGAPAGR
jgi:hypothetical protein